MAAADILIIALTALSMSLTLSSAVWSITYRRRGVVLGVATGTLGLALALFTALSGYKPLLPIIAANIITISVFLWVTGTFKRIWTKRRTRKLRDTVRSTILERSRELGFKRAYAAAVLGNHGSAAPMLSGTHFSYEKEDFLIAAPALDWPVQRTEELDALIWASIREHDTGAGYFAPDMSVLFEKVYTDLLPFSGRVTEENIARVLAVASRYGISQAVHVIDGDMPEEYLAALGADLLGEPRDFWWGIP